ncbi:MAG TPA: MOSC domain-containing protein [Acidimicrobiia bacterium]|nr:MOSC domain-containing protein [Acidimicrobiia bacterium]
MDRAFLSASGLEGDRHTDRVHHGGPLRAVCLFSEEVIAALKAEGHPIFRGAAGENVTVSGVNWIDVVPGTRWAIGEEAEVEVTSYTTPCYKNSGWFVDGQFTRISQSLHPGFARVYARVLVEGSIAAGDQFTRTD